MTRLPIRRNTLARCRDFLAGAAFMLAVGAAWGEYAEAGPFGLFGRPWIQSSGGCANGQCGQQAVAKPSTISNPLPIRPLVTSPIDEAAKARIRVYLKGGL